VQGDSAPDSLVKAIERVGSWGGADVVIIGRGGGSREDLWCFNDERVARAIAASPIPTISAVGHEVDVSIADFVADVRAATPTAAAELVAPVLSDIYADLRGYGELMRERLVRRTREGRRELTLARTSIRTATARRVVDARRDLATLRVTLRGGIARRATEARHELVVVREALKSRVRRLAERRGHSLGVVSGRLNVLSPLRTLERGYAVARTTKQVALSRASQFKAGMKFNLKLQDGEVDATTDAVRPGEGA
jgi:exodeoxyribonuclease VII large subunit